LPIGLIFLNGRFGAIPVGKLSTLKNTIKDYQKRSHLNLAFRTHKVLKGQILYTLPVIHNLEKKLQQQNQKFKKIESKKTPKV
jgi:hypothetical protein